jgi:hypothetical protein
VTLSIDALDRLISRSPFYILAGFALIGVEVLAGIGVLSAFSLIALGAMLASVTDYRRERGLWMLALLFGGTFLVFVLLWEYFAIVDAIRGAQVAWQVAVDAAIAIRCQWLLIRAMATVIAYNRRVTDASSL